ncbi:hypothetical protein BJ165DRAFT_673354 [Panaeolus papilionaceus]|nr:hypothetical protein BJ165DRAFT_673354 [Panaeolus papilionaceus]
MRWFFNILCEVSTLISVSLLPSVSMTSFYILSIVSAQPKCEQSLDVNPSHSTSSTRLNPNPNPTIQPPCNKDNPFTIQSTQPELGGRESSLRCSGWSYRRSEPHPDTPTRHSSQSLSGHSARVKTRFRLAPSSVPPLLVFFQSVDSVHGCAAGTDSSEVCDIRF